MRPATYNQVDDDPVQAYSLERACNAYSVGKDTIRAALNAGHLRGVKLGKRLLLRRADLEAWLSAQPSYSPAIAA